MEPMRSRAGAVATSMRRKKARATEPPAIRSKRSMSVPEVDDLAEDEGPERHHHEHHDDQLVPGRGVPERAHVVGVEERQEARDEEGEADEHVRGRAAHGGEALDLLRELLPVA